MALSEKFINEKMLEVERERLEVDKNTTKVLADIRDLIMANTILKFAELADSHAVSEANYNRAKDAFADAKKSIEKRWSE
jgi:hypothetical protein